LTVAKEYGLRNRQKQAIETEAYVNRQEYPTTSKKASEAVFPFSTMYL
jgi:hypothetical protein